MTPERKLITQMMDCIEELRYSSNSFSADRKTAAVYTAAREYLAAQEQENSELLDALDTIELLEMRIDQLESPNQTPFAWATHHDEPMLFPTREEAKLHCDDDEEPIALYAEKGIGKT